MADALASKAIREKLVEPARTRYFRTAQGRPRWVRGGWDGGLANGTASFGWWLDAAWQWNYENAEPNWIRAGTMAQCFGGVTVPEGELLGACSLLGHATFLARYGFIRLL